MSTPKAPVARGTKDPALLAQVRQPSSPGGGHVYLVNRRPLSYRGVMLPVGVEVPDASSWTRLEAWLTNKRVRLADRDEEFVSFEQFLATIEPEADSTPVPDPAPPPPPPPPAPNPGSSPVTSEIPAPKE